MPAGFVYVLHFDQPIVHAQHYIGCTTELSARLLTHARGEGAALTRALRAYGIEWECVAVGETDATKMRRIERGVKKWKGAARFCPTCNPRSWASIPGTRPVEMHQIAGPMRSNLMERQPVPTYYERTGLQTTLHELEQIRRLMQTERHAVGLVPVTGGAGVSRDASKGQVIVAKRWGQIVGYVYYTAPQDRTQVNIIQVAVRDSVRGCGIGRELVRLACECVPNVPAHAKVRDDLVANEFWTALGFEVIEVNTHETSGSQLNHYVRGITQKEGK